MLHKIIICTPILTILFISSAISQFQNSFFTFKVSTGYDVYDEIVLLYAESGFQIKLSNKVSIGPYILFEPSFNKFNESSTTYHEEFNGQRVFFTSTLYGEASYISYGGGIQVYMMLIDKLNIWTSLGYKAKRIKEHLNQCYFYNDDICVPGPFDNQTYFRNSPLISLELGLEYNILNNYFLHIQESIIITAPTEIYIDTKLPISIKLGVGIRL